MTTQDLEQGASTRSESLPARSYELRRIFVLSAPVAVAQILSMTMGFVDVLMVSRIGVDAIGAGQLGRMWVFGSLVVGLGILHGLDPLFSQGFGARDRDLLGLTLQRGLVVCGLLTLPLALIWLVARAGLVLLGQDEHLAALAQEYVLVQLPGLPAFLVFSVVRQYLQGRGIMLPAMWVLLFANGVNILANWALIFGHLGLPALGLRGAGIATGATQIFMLVALIAWVRIYRLQRGAWSGWSARALRRAKLRRIFVLGFPVGVQMGLEMWAFGIATLLAGLLGKVELAAHTIVLNLAALSYMVPLGISIGASTRVGNLIGARRPMAAQRAAWMSFALGAGVMSVAAIVFVALRHELPSWYTDEARVLELSAAILPIAAAFQLFDGVQAVGGGILRGMGHTRPAAVFNFVGYYVLALPFGAWLVLSGGGGLAGIWWGLAAGLFAVAMFMLVWVRHRGPARVRARVA